MVFFKRLLKWLALIAVIVVLGSYLLPRDVYVSRMASIAAPPDKVFAHLNSLQRVSEWSPWSALDPDMKVSFSGPEEGVGNKMEWQSDNPNVGSGTQIITASVANEQVATELDFGEMGQGKAEFLISEKAGGTAVEWNFQTDLGMNPLARWMGLMISETVGTDYEKGLARLKETAEAM